MSEDREENLMMEILRRAYPERTDKQILPFALIYAGVLWGRDYRFGEVPRDAAGRPVNICSKDEDYRNYLSWLADYLYHLKAEPNEEQAGLSKWVARMVPQDAMIFLGMNTALYFTNIAMWMKRWVEDDSPFSEYWQEGILEDPFDDPEYIPDREDTRKEYERVKEEHKEHKKHCPDVCHADVAYRIPLSVALKKVESKKEREKLLDIYYRNFNDYLDK
ncbi:MAG: hypothetical protein RAO92_04040 [Candidatus Euphemobacter frigidus]|nr:hypothetical protein [Candidatus Euphemobacter frigidus]MDP8275555.1 hypothetical protein [Candidatus Euphemobacter frigidus]